MLDRYVEAGGSFIDTANNYAVWWGGDGGDSERVLGDWMKTAEEPGQPLPGHQGGVQHGRMSDRSLSAAIIKREIEGSLKRLGTDHVDLYYAHQDRREDPLEETLGAFDALRREGKIRFVGCSNYRAWRIEQARAMSRAHGWAGVLLRPAEVHLPSPWPGCLLRPPARGGRRAHGLLRRSRRRFPAARVQLDPRRRLHGTRRPPDPLAVRRDGHRCSAWPHSRR